MIIRLITTLRALAPAGVRAASTTSMLSLGVGRNPLSAEFARSAVAGLAATDIQRFVKVPHVWGMLEGAPLRTITSAASRGEAGFSDALARTLLSPSTAAKAALSVRGSAAHWLEAASNAPQTAADDIAYLIRGLEVNPTPSMAMAARRHLDIVRSASGDMLLSPADYIRGHQRVLRSVALEVEAAQRGFRL